MKVLELEKLGLVELDASEMSEIDGGKGWWDLPFWLEVYEAGKEASISAYNAFNRTVDNIEKNGL